MTREDLARGVAKLAAAYREKLDQAVLEVYYEMLASVANEDFVSAVNEAIRTSPFFPRISELLEHAEAAYKARQPVLVRPPLMIAAPPEYPPLEHVGLLNLWQERDRRMREQPVEHREPTDEELQAHAERKANALALLRRLTPDS